MKTKSKNCPIKNKKLFLIVSISIAVIIVALDLVFFQISLKQGVAGCGLSRLFKNIDCCLINNDKKNNKVINSDGFKIKANYLGDNKWEYKITGQLPNPCYSTDVTQLVAESYPEQVTINLVMTQPSSGAFCTQVIKDFEYEGSFSASKDATISFNTITGNRY